LHIFNMKWMETVKTNSIKAWLLAARPKTLAGAAVPVMLGCALAAADGWFQIVHTLFSFCFSDADRCQLYQ